MINGKEVPEVFVKMIDGRICKLDAGTKQKVAEKLKKIAIF